MAPSTVNGIVISTTPFVISTFVVVFPTKGTKSKAPLEHDAYWVVGMKQEDNKE